MIRGPAGDITLDPTALALLMPMHLALDRAGNVTSCGPTLEKTVGTPAPGRRFLDLFEPRRPSGIRDTADLRNHAGQRLHLHPRNRPETGLRGIAVPLPAGGVLLNLSFGIGLVEAVRDHGLTDADFAATDLAVELLYVVEAKSAVAQELRALNLRLQGAKSAAEHQALTDMLTGLHNRRAFESVLEKAVAAQRTFGLIHLDLDFFKTVNDTLGHAAGDHVLRRVAQVLAEETRADDTVARLGGDEFAIHLPGLTDPRKLRAIATRIIDRLAEPILYRGQPCHVAASIGLALSSGSAATAAGLLEAADQALYAAKRAGRGCCRLVGEAHADLPKL